MLVLRATGSSFQAAGPAIKNALLPKCVCTHGTSKVPEVDDLSHARLSRDEVGTSVSVI